MKKLIEKNIIKADSSEKLEKDLKIDKLDRELNYMN
jgi:hypothetical protein